MDFGIRGRNALVTGASTGIGKAVARLLAAEGVNLIMAARNEARLEAAVEEIRQSGRGGHNVVGVSADVTTIEGCQTVVEQSRKHLPSIDILINNAGSSRPRPIELSNVEDWWTEAFALNFLAARRISEGFVPAMQAQRWGRIINLTGAMTSAKANAAGPAKAALWSWSRTLSVETAPHGVTVNCVQPGRISTPQIVERLLPTEQDRQAEIDRGIPIGRFGEPEELAALVVFLASEPARYITGTQIPVDGGLLRMALP